MTTDLLHAVLPAGDRRPRPPQRRQRLRPPGARRPARARLDRRSSTRSAAPGHARPGRPRPARRHPARGLPDGTARAGRRTGRLGCRRGPAGRTRRGCGSWCSCTCRSGPTPARSAVLHVGRGRGHHQRVVTGAGAGVVRPAVGRVCRRRAPTPRPPARGSGAGGGTSFLCVAAVHPGKGHDLLLDALAQLGDRAWTLTCVGSLEVDPDHVARAADAGVRPVLGAPGDLHRPADRRRARRGVRRGRPGRAAVRGSRATAWSWARRWPTGCRWSRRAVGGVPEALGRCPGRRRCPGCWWRPTTRPPWPRRCAPGSTTRTCANGWVASPSGAVPTVRGWDAVAADLDLVLTAVGERGPVRRPGPGRRAVDEPRLAAGLAWLRWSAVPRCWRSCCATSAPAPSPMPGR